MHKISCRILPIAFLLSVFALPSKAALVGTSVTGSLTFGGAPSNYFDPGYGFVPPAGYLNISGTTVGVSAGAVEFGFDDGASRVSADFSDHQLTISDLIEEPGTNSSFEMMFTDAAFAGQYLIGVADNFPLNSRSLAGDVITLDYAGGYPTVGQTLTATFTVTPVPEPSTAGFLSVSILGTLAVFGRTFRLRFSRS